MNKIAGSMQKFDFEFTANSQHRPIILYNILPSNTNVNSHGMLFLKYIANYSFSMSFKPNP